MNGLIKCEQLITFQERKSQIEHAGNSWSALHGHVVDGWKRVKWHFYPAHMHH